MDGLASAMSSVSLKELQMLYQPDPTEALIKAAAEKIAEASFLLIGAGAGFSADSGLAVYKDIANVAAWRDRRLTYPELCNPQWLPNDPETFFGFHGTCLNNYRDTEPHAGYRILLRWMNEHFNKELLANGERTQCHAYVYTSNVDAHFEKAGFPRHRIHACHGEQEYWQCSDGECKFPIVRPPLEWRFDVDAKTMLAPLTAPTKEDSAPPPQGPAVPVAELRDRDVCHAAFRDNHPRCQVCKSYLRPNILMFGDMEWRSMRSRTLYDWKDTVRQLCKADPTRKVVVLELGCGKNVPTIKSGCQIFADSFARGQSCVIRINPHEPDLHGYDSVEMIRIPARAIDVLPKIDALLQKARGSSGDNTVAAKEGAAKVQSAAN